MVLLVEQVQQVPGGQYWEGRPNPPADIPPHLHKYVPRVQSSIERKRALYHTLAGDDSLQFVPGNGFATDLRAGIVKIGLDDYPVAEQLGIIDTPEFEDMQTWSACHELGHFRDLRENPRAMLGNLEYLQAKAASLAPRALSIIEAKLGHIPDYLKKPVPLDKEKNVPAIEAFLIKQLFDFYNHIDDIYINRDIPNNVTKYAQPGSAGDIPQKLYRDFLFPTDPTARGVAPQPLQAADYEKLPLSAQFALLPLRRMMVPDQAILVSKDINDAYASFADKAAEEMGMTLNDEVRTFTSPATRRAKDVQWRYERIRQTVEPVFIDFLLRDIENQPLPTEEELNHMLNQTQQGMEGQEGEEHGQPSPWNSVPSHHHSAPQTTDELKEFIKNQDEKVKAEEDKRQEEERKARLTPDERSQEAQSQGDRMICQEFNIDPKLAQEYRQLAQSVEPYRNDLAEVFEMFMQTIQQRISTFWIEGFRSGKFNAERFIRKYGPDLATQHPESITWEMLDAYDRREIMSKLGLWPTKIRLRLVLDGSGSTEGERILAEKQLAVLFFEGLSTFEATMNLRFQLKDPLVINTELWMFGSNGKAELVKPLQPGKRDNNRELAQRFAAMGKINSSYGGTCEAEPLWAIASSITPEYEADLKNGKAKDILAEVTDGGTRDVSSAGESLVRNIPMGENVEYNGQQVAIRRRAAQDSRNALAAVGAKGVVARAFQIGDPEPWEQAVFDMIWGTNGTHTPHLKDVVPDATKMFADEILNTRFMINYYTETE